MVGKAYNKCIQKSLEKSIENHSPIYSKNSHSNVQFTDKENSEKPCP